MSVQGFLDSVFDDDLSVRIVAYDGSSVGPADAAATIVIRSPAAIRRIVLGLGRELALARAYVAGEVDFEGDIYEIVKLRDRVDSVRVTGATMRTALSALDAEGRNPLSKLRPPPPPPEEVRLRGVRHSKGGTRMRSPRTTTCPTTSTEWFSGHP